MTLDLRLPPYDSLERLTAKEGKRQGVFPRMTWPPQSHALVSRGGTGVCHILKSERWQATRGTESFFYVHPLSWPGGVAGTAWGGQSGRETNHSLCPLLSTGRSSQPRFYLLGGSRHLSAQVQASEMGHVGLACLP